jgi:predicted SprT family Zn-dependent metalloprotease
MNVPPIDAWLARWAAVWGIGDLSGRVRVEPGRRLRRSLGRCRPGSGQITVLPALFEPENAELLREVVCHEAAHAAAHILHGNVQPHGREWKDLMIAAGYEPKARMDPRRLPGGLLARMRPTTRYRHTCTICGAWRMAGRRVQDWRCRRCRQRGLEGRLRVVRVAFTGET